MTHPITGYGPSLGDQGIGSEDAPLVQSVRNCIGCDIEYDRQTGAATLRSCAVHDAEEHAATWEEAQALYAALRRLADGCHAGDAAERVLALAQADALIGQLAKQYADTGEGEDA